MNILCIYRAKSYSPNMVEKDKAILDSVASKLRIRNHVVECVSEDVIDFKDYDFGFDVIFSMARLPKTLHWLKSLQRKGVRVINTPDAVVMAGHRSLLFPHDDFIEYPVWLKKAEGYSQTQEDVIYVEDEAAMEEAIKSFHERGIDDVYMSHHVEGDLVKFYCVAGTDFFVWKYLDESFSKFGWEEHNRQVFHYMFSKEDLRREAEKLAERTGLVIYGGDCIVREDGTFEIIDINDWPSFSSCMDEASQAIVTLIDQLKQTRQDNNSKVENISSTLKSSDTEEWLDVVFTRKVGFAFARLFRKLGWHPNTVTIISMVLGACAGLGFFSRADSLQGLIYNIIGVAMLMTANFLDSADGQLARMTGKKTRLGRILDGAAGDVWFIAIYYALCQRLFHQNIPFLQIEWGWWVFVLAAISGFICHARQCSLADYYRNIHLFFIRGNADSELDSYARQKEINNTTKWGDDVLWKFFLTLYVNYTKTQEKQTPQFQRLMFLLNEKYGKNIPLSFRVSFRRMSLPLMKWANILTFNTRAIVLYVTCLLDVPWLYWVFEITVMSVLYLYMRHTHESFCKKMSDNIELNG